MTQVGSDARVGDGTGKDVHGLRGVCVIYFAVVYRGKRAGATAAMRRGQQEKPAVDSGTA